MLEKIIVAALVVLALAYMVQRAMRKGGSGCGCASSGGCCGGGQTGIKNFSDCNCTKKS
jgi:hypothetical protein